MRDDLSDFQALFGQNIGRHVIIKFPSGKNVSGKVKAVAGSLLHDSINTVTYPPRRACASSQPGQYPER